VASGARRRRRLARFLHVPHRAFACPAFPIVSTFASFPMSWTPAHEKQFDNLA
jgi:hypothetical protein